MSTRRKGAIAESIAQNYLYQKGFSLIQQNYYCKGGEVDLIMQKDDWTIFIEVKSISAYSERSIFGTITKEKKVRLAKAINSWLIKEGQMSTLWRCDFVGIEIGKQSHKIHHFNFLNLNE